MAVLMRKNTSKKRQKIKPTYSLALYILIQGHLSSYAGSILPKSTPPWG